MAKMGESERDFQKGDWIVHLYHGVGQIKGVVRKRVNGERTPFYRVQTRDSTLYIPVEGLDESRLRPLVSNREFKEALKILARPPGEMAPDHSDRKSRIREVKTDGSLAEIARLVRDLNARRAEKRLNNTEERALRRFKRRLLREWSVFEEIDVEQARVKLNEILREASFEQDA